MTVIGWLADPSTVVGGAELTQQAFRDTAPAGLTVVGCPPAGEWPDVDVFVVHNCTQYSPDVIARFADRPVVKYHHDVAPHVHPDLRSWLLRCGRNLYCSLAQHDFMDRAYGAWNTGSYVPPAMDLRTFRDAASSARSGTVWLGNMLNHGKGLRQAVEWAERNGPVRFYGDGPLRPEGPNVNDWGPIDYDKVPELLGSAQRLVFLPTALEPFGRVVAEAWAAGCEVITNDLVGARWWIENDPDALDTATDQFWMHVGEACA